jgi:hypothetical protein
MVKRYRKDLTNHFFVWDKWRQLLIDGMKKEDHYGETP